MKDISPNLFPMLQQAYSNLSFLTTMKLYYHNEERSMWPSIKDLVLPSTWHIEMIID